ncbi:MAG: hypothetical protein GX620_15135 [Chloroflexi bacterium]|nr:hypothetical protein [Chloroflexota bacterium]
MNLFRYDVSGRWYKGNTHIHSLASDGGKSFSELAEMYAAEGYDFLFRTDHWVASDAASDPCEYPLLWLDGIELNGRDYGGSEYHVNCLGTFSDISTEMGFIPALEAVRAQDGLLILAHPHWMGNSLEDARRYGFDGVEVYNNVCNFLNGKGDAGVYWHAMLRRFPNTLGFAVDDAHIRPDEPAWNGGWIVVNAPELTPSAIITAIRAGNFYSSRGPDFRGIGLDGRVVHVKVSPVSVVRLIGPAYWSRRVCAGEGQVLTEVQMEIPDEWPYALIEIEDGAGRRAWTNTLFCSEGGHD